MRSGSVEALLAALERYLTGGEAAESTPAQAYVAGLRDGYALARRRRGEGEEPPPGSGA